MSDNILKTIQHYESMTSAEILAELDRLGIDARPTIEAVKAMVGAYKHHHDGRRVHSGASLLAPAGAIWRGSAEPMAAASNRPAALQRGFFSSYDEAAHRLQHSESVDAAYIHFAGMTDIAIDVSRHHEHRDDFVTSLARLVARCAVPVQCVAVYATRHWGTLGGPMDRLTAAFREELVRHELSDEAQLLLSGAGCPGIHAVRDALLEEMRRHVSFTDAAPFSRLVEELHHGVLPSFLAMDALSDVFLCAIELGQHDAVKHWILDRVGVDSTSHFTTLGSLAGARDRHPHFAASLLAEVVLAGGHIARQIAFSMIVEGYERSFAGVPQPRVPHFEHGEHPRFVPGTHHELDLFGHRVCDSHVAHELEQEMAWANHRFALR